MMTVVRNGLAGSSVVSVMISGKHLYTFGHSSLSTLTGVLPSMSPSNSGTPGWYMRTGSPGFPPDFMRVEAYAYDCAGAGTGAGAGRRGGGGGGGGGGAGAAAGGGSGRLVPRLCRWLFWSFWRLTVVSALASGRGGSCASNVASCGTTYGRAHVTTRVCRCWKHGLPLACPRTSMKPGASAEP